MMLLKQDGRGEEEGDVVDNVEKAVASAGEPNTLTLFEEASGNPSQVNVQIVIACDSASEGEMVEEGASSTRLGSWKHRRW
ncbi:hypothetical protein GW17_00057038 [Ensete ventricosum]|nr:hypothetical protein GW17_00057038 [Ensete ventricosum]